MDALAEDFWQGPCTIFLCRLPLSCSFIILPHHFVEWAHVCTNISLLSSLCVFSHPFVYLQLISLREQHLYRVSLNPCFDLCVAAVRLSSACVVLAGCLMLPSEVRSQAIS